MNDPKKIALEDVAEQFITLFLCLANESKLTGIVPEKIFDSWVTLSDDERANVVDEIMDFIESGEVDE